MYCKFTKSPFYVRVSYGTHGDYSGMLRNKDRLMVPLKSLMPLYPHITSAIENIGENERKKGFKSQQPRSTEVPSTVNLQGSPPTLNRLNSKCMLTGG